MSQIEKRQVIQNQLNRTERRKLVVIEECEEFASSRVRVICETTNE